MGRKTLIQGQFYLLFKIDVLFFERYIHTIRQQLANTGEL